MYSFSLHHLLLLQSSDIEINPGPKKCSRLNFCHWNLNGIAAHDFVKVTLEAFIEANNIGIICLPETFLDSTIPFNDERLYIKGYVTSHFVITVALCNNSLSHFVIPDALCNKRLSHFVITL